VWNIRVKPLTNETVETVSSEATSITGIKPSLVGKVVLARLEADTSLARGYLHKMRVLHIAFLQTSVVHSSKNKL